MIKSLVSSPLICLILLTSCSGLLATRPDYISKKEVCVVSEQMTLECTNTDENGEVTHYMRNIEPGDIVMNSRDFAAQLGETADIIEKLTKCQGDI